MNIISIIGMNTQNANCSINNAIISKMSNMMKSVENTHPNTQMITAITIIDNRNDKQPLISFMNFVSVLI